MSRTARLVQLVGRPMRMRRSGRILLTGAIPGFGRHNCDPVADGINAFIELFAFALRAELTGTGVTVTCLMPGATGTDDVARLGFEALMRGDGEVISGWKNSAVA